MRASRWTLLVWTAICAGTVWNCWDTLGTRCAGIVMLWMLGSLLVGMIFAAEE